MNHPTFPDLSLVRRLVLEHGRNSTCYQLLTPGIRYWFAPDRAGVVGYVERGRARVVAGVPVCEMSQLLACWDQFAQETERQGRHLCAVGVEAPLATLLQARASYSVVKVGAQPVWNPADWEALITEHGSIRSQVNRAQNKGVRVAEWDQQAAREPSLRRCWHRWLEGQPLPPLHFLTEPRLLENLMDRRLFVATQAERVVAFMVLAPIPRRDGWLAELSVRDPDAPNGTMARLLDGVMRVLADGGSALLSLGTVPLTQRGEGRADPLPRWAEWLRRTVLTRGSRFYNMEGLESFKAKFQPDYWESTYLVSREPRLSPHTLYAVTAAFTGGSPLRFGWQALRRTLRSMGAG